MDNETTNETPVTPVTPTPNPNSILVSVKKMLGIDAAYTHFDQDIIMHINSVLSILWQLGIGPAAGYSITGDTETWANYITDMSKLQLVKTYVYLKVKLLFDPPTSGPAIEAVNNSVKELEWRINVQVDSSNT